MAFASANLEAVATATAAAANTATARTTALLAGLGPAIIKDISGIASCLTVNQQVKFAAAQADLIANVGAFVTALEVTI